MAKTGKDFIAMQLSTLDKKIKILEYIAAVSGAYYSFDLTRNIIPGTVIQYVDGTSFSANTLADLPEDCSLTEYWAFWGKALTGQEQRDYFSFFNRDHLLNGYAQGKKYAQYTYWTTTVTGKPMLADQHIFLYRSEENGNILGITYIIDLTENYHGDKYAQKLSQDLSTERQYLDVLARDYYTVYHVDLNTNTSLLLKSDPVITAAKLGNSQLRKPTDYLQRINLYAEKYVVEGNRQKFRERTEPAYMHRMMENSSRYSFRYRSIPNEAGYQYFEAQVIRINPQKWDGHLLLAFQFIDDVIDAEQKRQIELQEHLALEQKHLEMLTVISQSYYAIFSIDLEKDTYEKLACRKEFRHLYNNSTSAKTELKELCRKVIVSEDQERMLRFFDLSTLSERMKGKDSLEMECLTVTGDWHRARFVPKQWDCNGKLTQVFYVSKQVNSEKEREHTLISIAESATDANAAKTEFISQVAHDIRTPMNAMFGFLKIAQSCINDPQRVAYCLDKIQSAGQFLNELANDVLDISRMEAGKLHLQPTQISLIELLRDSCTAAEYSQSEKHLDFQFCYNQILHNQVILDPLRLRQIYSNVLGNAVKYTPDGGTIRFTVWQEESTTPGNIRILSDVSDTGVGMSQEFMERMYEKFERATDTRINKIGGHGLGLAIVKQLVELMGGTITVESTLGEGTTIHIELEVPYVREERISLPTPDQASTENIRGMHLLVAEDNALNMEVLRELLAMQDITCDGAEDGLQCVKIFLDAAPGTYDAILMDMQMPNLNGPDTARVLRASPHPQARTIPIFAMTANVSKDDIQTCLDSGMNLHLAKPLDMDALLQALAAHR